LDILHTIVDLAQYVKTAVTPYLGRQDSKNSAGKTESGDEEFLIDEVAEHAIDEYLRKRDISVAYYSEGRGLVETGCWPEHLLIIDPIDGTRPAMVGLEGGVVSIAAAPYTKDARMRDVTDACILELKSGRLYTALKGGCVKIREKDRNLPVDTTLLTDLDRMSWSYEIAGRPISLITGALSPLINRSSIQGGVFTINSTAFSLTRLVSGQFDAVVDVGNRILRDRPSLRDQFVSAGLGKPIGLFPYDIAAALLIVKVAGCSATDAYGNSLDDVLLLDTSEANISSLVAASNPMLHEQLLAEVDQGIQNI
jgi:myo-inositol-1(or 4)-monophosphatase